LIVEIEVDFVGIVNIRSTRGDHTTQTSMPEKNEVGQRSTRSITLTGTGVGALGIAGYLSLASGSVRVRSA
jgi:hypothetical protein